MSEATGARQGMLARHLQPLRVLVEHRVDDVDERLVAVEQAMAAGEQVALEPALAEVLAEHLHHPPLGREMVVAGQTLGHPGAIGHLEYGAQAVGGGLVGAPDAEAVGVAHDDVAQPRAEHARGLARAPFPARAPARRSRGSRAAPGRAAAARRWRAGSRPCAACPGGPARRARGAARPARRTAPLGGRSAATAPSCARCSGLLARVGERHLMGAKGPLGRQPVDLLGSRPALGRAQHDHRPGRALPLAVGARAALDRGDLRRCTPRAWRPSAGASPAGRRPRRSAARSRSPRTAPRAPRGGCAPARSDWRSCTR